MSYVRDTAAHHPRAPAPGAAGGAGVDHLPGHHRRGAAAHAGGVGPHDAGGLLPGLLARARGPGQRVLLHRHHPQAGGRGQPGVDRGGRRPLLGPHRPGGAGVVVAGGRGGQAAREHLPRGQHRPGERAQDDLRPHGHRHLGGHRGGQDQALRLPGLLPRARAWAGTASPSTPSTSPGRRPSTACGPASSSWPARSTPACPATWSHRLAEALADDGKTLNGAKVLVLGLSYKADIDDDRESPSYEIIELLQERGAEVAYCDPHIPVAHPGRQARPAT